MMRAIRNLIVTPSAALLVMSAAPASPAPMPSATASTMPGECGDFWNWDYTLLPPASHWHNFAGGPPPQGEPGWVYQGKDSDYSGTQHPEMSPAYVADSVEHNSCG